jgi:hypothetical protein
MNRIMAPFAAATKASRLQGKCCSVRGSVPFGGRDELICLFAPAQVLPQRGHGGSLPTS